MFLIIRPFILVMDSVFELLTGGHFVSLYFPCFLTRSLNLMKTIVPLFLPQVHACVLIGHYLQKSRKRSWVSHECNKGSPHGFEIQCL